MLLLMLFRVGVVVGVCCESLELQLQRMNQWIVDFEVGVACHQKRVDDRIYSPCIFPNFNAMYHWWLLQLVLLEWWCSCGWCCGHGIYGTYNIHYSYFLAEVLVLDSW